MICRAGKNLEMQRKCLTTHCQWIESRDENAQVTLTVFTSVVREWERLPTIKQDTAYSN